MFALLNLMLALLQALETTNLKKFITFQKKKSKIMPILLTMKFLVKTGEKKTEHAVLYVFKQDS